MDRIKTQTTTGGDGRFSSPDGVLNECKKDKNNKDLDDPSWRKNEVVTKGVYGGKGEEGRAMKEKGATRLGWVWGGEEEEQPTGETAGPVS